jgi:Flp pilus assembly protein TadD
VAHTNLGVAYSELGQHKRAIREFEKAIRLDHKDPVPVANIGHTRARLGQYSEAIRLLRKALRMDAGRRYTLHILGAVLIEQEVAVAEGIRMLQKAKRKEPKNAQVLADLALGYWKAGRKKQAQRWAREAKKLAPHDRLVRDQTQQVLDKHTHHRGCRSGG